MCKMYPFHDPRIPLINEEVTSYKDGYNTGTYTIWHDTHDMWLHLVWQSHHAYDEALFLKQFEGRRLGALARYLGRVSGCDGGCLVGRQLLNPLLHRHHWLLLLNSTTSSVTTLTTTLQWQHQHINNNTQSYMALHTGRRHVSWSIQWRHLLWRKF